MNGIGLESLLRRDRIVVAAALAAVIALAWIYVLRLGAGMDMGGMDMTGFRMISTGLAMAMAPAQAPWSGTEFALTFAMWTVMMIGMMTPSAAPMILIYARAGRMASAAGSPLVATGWFAAAYLGVWTGFALAATTAQFALGRLTLLDPAMASVSNTLGGALLIVAGLYQWTPLKQSCLSQCQSPLLFIQRHGGFQKSIAAALRLGGEHGLYCLGCCWALMAILFVGGVMNITWIAGAVLTAAGVRLLLM